MSLRAAFLCVVLLVVVGCGDDGGSGTTTGSATSTSDASTTTSAPDGGDVSGGLPGEPVDTFPYEGATLAVVGVAADDVLNVRAGPGVEFDVEFTLDPLFAGATATGHNRQLSSGAIWAEISAEGGTGWANTAFLLQPGQVTDETAALYPNPTDRPRAETMEELAALVAEEYFSEGPGPEVTIVDGPTVGDLGEVTVDVIGVGDDSVGGYRLHLFAEPDPTGGSFTLRTVEATVLCSRGVSDGICV